MSEVPYSLCVSRPLHRNQLSVLEHIIRKVICGHSIYINAVTLDLFENWREIEKYCVLVMCSGNVFYFIIRPSSKNTGHIAAENITLSRTLFKIPKIRFGVNSADRRGKHMNQPKFKLAGQMLILAED